MPKLWDSERDRGRVGTRAISTGVGGRALWHGHEFVHTKLDIKQAAMLISTFALADMLDETKRPIS